MRTNRLLDLVATAAVVLSPALMLAMKGGTGYCYFVVFALSLIYLCNAANRRRAAELYREHRLFVWGLVGMPCVVLFQILVVRTGTFPELDPLLRLGLAVSIFFFLSSLPSRHLRLVQWGFVAGAIAVGVWAAYARAFIPEWAPPVRLGNSFTNQIPFGDTALLLGALSIASLTRGQRPSTVELAVKLVAFCAGVYASYVSGSRGGWIAIPVLIWATANNRHWLSSMRARLAFACVLFASVAAFACTSIVRDRFEAFGADVHQIKAGNLDTSTGERLELWRASVLLYERHPILGVGRGRLESALRTLAEHGEASRTIVNGRAHSEFFSALSETGTVGVVALFLLYIGTLGPFWRNRRSADPEIATAASLGIGLVGSTILFGLTIDVFTLVMNAAFFALTAATLLAWIEARKRELGGVGASARQGE
jgi:O-antigen ligase